MILLKNEIKKAIKKGKIKFSGNIKNIGPNSVDVTLGKTFKTLVPTKIGRTKNGDYFFKEKKLPKDFFLDVRKENKVYEFEIPDDGIILQPGQLYIAGTIEIAGSDELVPMYEGRSSMARLGIQSHISAGFGDIGFKDKWTLEIIVVHPIKIYPDMRIGQVAFHTVNKKALKKLKRSKELYNSKYSNNNAAKTSLSFKDFDKNGKPKGRE